MWLYKTLIGSTGLKQAKPPRRHNQMAEMSSTTTTAESTSFPTQPIVRAQQRFISAAARLRKSLPGDHLTAILQDVGSAIDSVPGEASLESAVQAIEIAITTLLSKLQKTSSKRHACTKEIIRRFFHASYPFLRVMLNVSQTSANVIPPAWHINHRFPSLILTA